MAGTNEKAVYICGPLTDLPETVDREKLKELYEEIAAAITKELDIDCFVPHKHYDPEEHAHFRPTQVYQAERERILKKTSCLVVIAVCPSWGGGAEVQICNEHDIPVILCYPAEGKISRFIRGGPAIKEEIPYKFIDGLKETIALQVSLLLKR